MDHYNWSMTNLKDRIEIRSTHTHKQTHLQSPTNKRVCQAYCFKANHRRLFQHYTLYTKIKFYVLVVCGKRKHGVHLFTLALLLLSTVDSLRKNSIQLSSVIVIRLKFYVSRWFVCQTNYFLTNTRSTSEEISGTKKSSQHVCHCLHHTALGEDWNWYRRQSFFGFHTKNGTP